MTVTHEQVKRVRESASEKLRLRIEDESHAPGSVMLRIGLGTCDVLVTAAFNTEDRWEACLELDGEQVGLPDGPDVRATVQQVVSWLFALTDPRYIGERIVRLRCRHTRWTALWPNVFACVDCGRRATGDAP